VALYNMYLKEVPLRTMLWWSMIIGTLLSATQLLLVSGVNKQMGLSNEMFALSDSAMLTVLGQVPGVSFINYHPPGRRRIWLYLYCTSQTPCYLLHNLTHSR
jgi:BT1 family